MTPHLSVVRDDADTINDDHDHDVPDLAHYHAHAAEFIRRRILASSDDDVDALYMDVFDMAEENPFDTTVALMHIAATALRETTYCVLHADDVLTDIEARYSGADNPAGTDPTPKD